MHTQERCFIAKRIVVIIPARNEALALHDLLPRIPAWVTEVIVVDNASTDATAEIARNAGAIVVHEARLGYGAACARGLAGAQEMDAEYIVFMDGDGSDDPAEIEALLRPLIEDEADLVIGRRVQQTGMTWPQILGTRLVCQLLSLGFGKPVRDIGPFRAAHQSLLRSLPLVDRGFGWTAEMQAEALRAEKRVLEVDVSWRVGKSPSEISGSLPGVLRAARDLLRHSLREIALYQFDRYRRYAFGDASKTRLSKPAKRASYPSVATFSRSAAPPLK